MIANTIEIAGTLQANGQLILDEKPALPPGCVRVALQPLVDEDTQVERLPDVPWLEDSIPAPFDLPRSGAVVRVHPRAVAERLPELPADPAEASQ